MLTLLITSFFGSLGFALVFRVKRSGILAAALGGVITCGVHLVCIELFSTTLFFSSLAAGAASQIYAQILARITRSPATVFYITSLIPLIPGGSLYRTMDALVSGEIGAFSHYGTQTLQVTLGLAIGVSLVAAVLHFFRKK